MIRIQKKDDGFIVVENKGKDVSVHIIEGTDNGIELIKLILKILGLN